MHVHIIITSLRNLLVPALSLVVLTQCGEKPSSTAPPPSATSEMAPKESEPPKESPLLEKIVQGIWETHDPAQLEEVGMPEKIQIDFRANGEMTMIVYNKGESRTEGEYQVKGDELFIRVISQEEDSIKTTYDGETLTVIDVDNDTKIGFQKL
ncbi:MAG: hypothetical protein ACI8T1_002346 [Verrucomicrobiales bacterium]|jgi:hypothetical protein